MIPQTPGSTPSLGTCHLLSLSLCLCMVLQEKEASRDGEHKKSCLQNIPTAALHTACSESSEPGGAGGARAGVLPHSSLSIRPSHRFSSCPVCSMTHLCSLPKCTGLPAALQTQPIQCSQQTHLQNLTAASQTHPLTHTHTPP